MPAWLPHPPHARLTDGRAAAVVALGAAAYLLVLGHWLLVTRAVSDIGIIANGAARLLQGQLPYRDFFLFVGPLGPALTALWLAAAGPGALSIVALVALVGTATALATFASARYVAPTGAALAAGLLFLPLGPLYWPTLSHHWFATLFAVLAMAATLHAGATRRAEWLVAAGALCALAGFSHQWRGATAFVGLSLAVLVAWPSAERARGLALAVLGAALVAAPAVALLVAATDVPATVYGLLSFALTEYPKANQVPYMALDLVPPGLALAPQLGALQSALAYAALWLGPLGVPLLAWRSRPRRGQAASQQTRGAWMIACFGGAAWVGVLYQPSAVHLGYAAPWWLAAWAGVLGLPLRREGESVRRPLRLVVAGLAAVSLVWLPVPQVLAILGGQIVWVPAPTGPVPLGAASDAALYSGSFAEVARFLDERSTEGDRVAFYPYRSINNVLLQRVNPLRLDLVHAGENTEAQVREVIDDLTERRLARFVVIEKGPAERLATQPGAPEASELGCVVLATLRAELPLVFETAQVEVREARPTLVGGGDTGRLAP